MLKTTIVQLSLCAALLAAAPALGRNDPGVDRLMKKITSADLDTRYSARTEAVEIGAPAVAPLAGLIDETARPAAVSAEAQRLQREIAITARAALENIVHHAARPGAGEQRRAVAGELARLLKTEQTVKTSRELLYLVAFVGGDAEVPPVARYFRHKDHDVREAARFALERIPRESAALALVEAARKLPDEQKPAVLISVGRRAEPETIPALLEFAREGKGPVRAAALKALAHAGAIEAVGLFIEAARTAEEGQRGALAGEFLRLADNLAASDHLQAAARMYRMALHHAPKDYQRERALHQLTETAVDFDALLTGLADPSDRVRRLALARTTMLRGPDVSAWLRKAYAEADAQARPALLRVLAEKDSKAAGPVIEDALESTQAELKLTALDLTGGLDKPGLTSFYLETARTGSARARPLALKGCLLLADRSLAQGHKQEALKMYGEVLRLATEPGQRSAAVEGLTRTGDPAALRRLQECLKDSALSVQAAGGIIALAARLGSAGEKDAAEQFLLEIVKGSLPKELRARAAGALKAMGRDPERAVHEQGFVTGWWVLTPIRDPDGKGLEKEYLPEKTIELDKVNIIEGRKFRWQKLTEVTLDGTYNLLTSFRRSSNVLTYAFTEITSPEPRDVLFKMGSDDGIACWLNGKRIHLKNAARGLTIDEDVVKAHLEKGVNRILLKISNGAADWGFAFRITDPAGKPIDLSSR